MPRRCPPSSHALVAATALFATACQSGSAPTADSASAPAPAATTAPGAETANIREPNTLGGIYTTAQAQRGRQVFEAICSNCHATEDWQDPHFRARWEGESVYRFWFYIYEQMPEGEPPYSLTRQQVTDVLTFILQLNGLPTGETALGSDDDSIDPYWLHWGSPPSLEAP